jgi:hypothetical protein
MPGLGYIASFNVSPKSYEMDTILIPILQGELQAQRSQGHEAAALGCTVRFVQSMPPRSLSSFIADKQSSWWLLGHALI